MDREDIIAMAREAEISFGLPPDAHKEAAERVFKRLERFAELVAAAEREACAKVCELKQHSEYDGYAECAAAIRARGQV